MLVGTQKPMLGTKLNRAHPLADGLVGCWLFNEGVGNKAYDTSGRGNHGTLTGMAFPPTTASGWNLGRKGYAVSFDGNNDYINCGNDPSLDITDAITIEAWVKPADKVGSNSRIISKGSVVYSLLYDGSDHINFVVKVDNDFRYAPVLDYTVNEWLHLVGTYSSTSRTLKLYTNGTFFDETILSGLASYDIETSGSLTIGSQQASYYFNGSIDGVKIYNRALSAEEIKWSYREPYAMFERGELLL